MKVAYITAQAPYGRGETFIIEEMLELKKTGTNLLIIPRNPTQNVFHEEAKNLLGDTLWFPLINSKMVVCLFSFFFMRPMILLKLVRAIFKNSPDIKILIKNLTILPKSIFVARLIKNKNVSHIHAHWGSTTATLAWLISELTGIPWSFTLHRWDITENNMLREKVKTADFVRCISKTGRKETLQIVGHEFADKIKLIHMGVKVPYSSATLPSNSTRGRKSFTIVCPANFVEVKGHRFLIKACSLLVRKGITNFQCLLFGEGPLVGEIRGMLQKLGLEECVKVPGSIPHEKLMEMYERREVDAVVLPSINTDRGDMEGIPVALMEAMAYGFPVISTHTGGIPELLSDGAGIIVQEQNPEQLAEAIEKLIKDEKLAMEVGERGYTRVKDQFNLFVNVKQLQMWMEKETKNWLSSTRSY